MNKLRWLPLFTVICLLISGCVPYSYHRDKVDFGFNNSKVSSGRLVIIKDPQVTIESNHCGLLRFKSDKTFTVIDPYYSSGDTVIPAEQSSYNDVMGGHEARIVFGTTCKDLDTYVLKIGSIEIDGKTFQISPIKIKTGRAADGWSIGFFGP